VGEVGVELEEVAEEVGSGVRAARAEEFGGDVGGRLAEAELVAAEDAFPRMVDLPPTEGLAGAERGGEVVVADGE
jgi:hypothetical protein